MRTITRTWGLLGVLALAACGAEAGTSTPSPTTIGTTTIITTIVTTTTVAEPSTGVLVAGEQGLTVLATNGERRTVASDPLYPALLAAVPDGTGGVVYTHTTTPLPWPQGSMLRLAPGALLPEVLVPGGSPGGAIFPTGLTPLDAYEGRDRAPVLIYLQESFRLDDYVRELWQVPVTDGGPVPLLRPAAGTFLSDADAAAGGLVAVALREGGCDWIEYLQADPSLDRLLPASPLPREGCAGGRSVEYLALSDDGGRLATIEVEGGRRLLRAYDVVSAEPIAEQAVETAYDLSDAGTAGFAVHLAAVTLAEPGADGWELTEIGAWEGRVEGFDVPPDLAAGATLGSGTGELPCTPGDPPALAPGLPVEVAAVAARIGSLAATCDYRGLAELVVADGSSYTFGGPIDPAVLWVTMARHSGHDPLEDTRVMLSLAPATQVDLWVWPALTVTGAEADLEELEAALGRSLQMGPEGYLGWRLGIESSGRLSFLIAGD